MSSGHVRDTDQAFKIAVDSMNKSPNDALPNNMSPDEVSDENVAEVLEFQIRKRDDVAAKVQGKFPRYSIGDYVRRRLTPSKFRKSNEPALSRDVYEIVGIKHSMPTPGYILRSLTTDATLPGSLDFSYLVKADDYHNNQ